MKKQGLNKKKKTREDETGSVADVTSQGLSEKFGTAALGVTGFPIGSGMTKEERSTGMTAEEGSGIPPSSASFPRRQESRSADSESGRSMVEMLGVLAIMGVLAIGGIAGYRYAMDKYNANEILNEVRKRAVTASQQRILGRTIDLSEWSNTIQGHSVTTADNYNGDTSFFALTVSGIEKSVCDKVIAEKISFAVEEKVGEVVVGEDTTCAEGNNDITFAFKNTLDGEGATGGGEEPEPSDPACEGVECPEGTSCSNGRCLCPTGQEVCGQKCCEEGQMCSSDWDGGQCVDVSGNCATNADCKDADGNVDKTKYCKITAGNCYGANARGTCEKLGGKSEATIEGLGTVYRSNSTMTWWSAKNWCEAQGKRLISVSDLQCDHLSEETYGYCCKDSGSCSSNITTQSAIMQALRRKWSEGLVWTNTSYSSCIAFGVNLYRRTVLNGLGRDYTVAYRSSALCVSR